MVFGCAQSFFNRSTPDPDGYLSPAEIIASADGSRLYIAAHTANRILEFDTAGKRVLRAFDLPARPTGLALSGDGSRLYVTGGIDPGKVYIIGVESGEILDTITVGHSPCTPVPAPNDSTLYVLNRFDNSMSIVDLAAGEVAMTVPMLREPVAADITSDGRYVIVANHLPSGDRIYDYVTDGGILMIGSYISTGYFQGNRESYSSSGVVLVFDTRHHRLAELIKLPNGATDLLGLTISPDGLYAYVTHIVGRYHLPTTQLERGWVVTNALSIIDVKRLALVNTIILDDLDLGAANPRGVTCTPDGAYVCVSHAGTDEVSLIDRRALHERLAAVARGDTVQASSSPEDVPSDLTFLHGIRTRIALGGKGPRGIVAAGRHVYAAEYFSDSIGTFEIGNKTTGKSSSIPLGPPKPFTAARKGEMYFNDAGLCFQQWLSCASCHPDGRADALNWDLLNDGIGNPKNTKSLLFSHRTPPVMITGVRDMAETAVRAGLSHIQFIRTDEETAEAIDAYLKALEPVPSPYLEKGRLSASARRGRKIFKHSGCADCHPAPLFTDLGSYDVATGIGADESRVFDTPTLVEIWRTRPYLYDGRADAMYDVLKTFNRYDMHGFTNELEVEDLGDLIEYIMSQ